MQSTAQTARNRLGGLTNAARNDTRRTTAAAHHAANWTRFADQVDPDRKLPAAELERRVVAARKAHAVVMRLAKLRLAKANDARSIP